MYVKINVFARFFIGLPRTESVLQGFPDPRKKSETSVKQMLSAGIAGYFRDICKLTFRITENWFVDFWEGRTYTIDQNVALIVNYAEV